MSSELDTPRGDSALEYRAGVQAPVPGLLLAAAPPGHSGPDRAAVSGGGTTLGRDREATWTIGDHRLSRLHTRFWLEDDAIHVADLGSTNGTFVDGCKLVADARPILPGQVVRCGNCVLVACADLGDLVPAGYAPNQTGLAGRFHAPGILSKLAEAAATGRHVLLAGESGSGKELAAHALHRLRAARLSHGGPLIEHNCARITGQDEATATLFGVGAGVFSEVKPRPGLLEQAAGGVLHLDEIHELPVRAQRSLLRFLEDGAFSRIGETTRRTLDLMVVCSTNLDQASPEAERNIAFDLRARMQEVSLPPLNKRRADIPAILAHQLGEVASRFHLDAGKLVGALRATALEALCLLDYTDCNVREIILLCEALVARIELEPTSPRQAFGRLLIERYPDNPVVRRLLAGDEYDEVPLTRPGRRRSRKPSRYQRLRQQIVTAYHQNDHNLSATTEQLKAQGTKVSRRWLSIWLDKWGER
ncbi:MAG: sigma 54-interacting transcriptional regulator [Pseudomonadota bacterium]